MNRKDPHEQQAMQPLVSAFRQAMHVVDCAMRTAGTLPFPFESWGELSQLAQTLVHQFDNQNYELTALRQKLEEQQLANQRLQTQFEYREKRESILEQAYVETQLALKSTEILLKRSEQDKYDIQKHARHLERSHANLALEHGELKGENERLKIGLATAEEFLAKEVQLGKLTSDELDDVKKAHAITKQDNSRLRMLARNRRHALIEVGNFLGGLPSTAMKGEALNNMIEKVAAMARPVDYRTGAALDQTEVYLGIQAPAPADADKLHVIAEDGSSAPLYTTGCDHDWRRDGQIARCVKDGCDYVRAPQGDEPEIVGVAEKLGYSKRAHDFPPGENMKDVACTRCGIGWLECVDDNHYCNAEEADDSGVNLGAQITSVAEAIQNGESQH